MKPLKLYKRVVVLLPAIIVLCLCSQGFAFDKEPVKPKVDKIDTFDMKNKTGLGDTSFDKKKSGVAYDKSKEKKDGFADPRFSGKSSTNDMKGFKNKGFKGDDAKDPFKDSGKALLKDSKETSKDTGKGMKVDSFKDDKTGVKQDSEKLGDFDKGTMDGKDFKQEMLGGEKLGDKLSGNSEGAAREGYGSAGGEGFNPNEGFGRKTNEDKGLGGKGGKKTEDSFYGTGAGSGKKGDKGYGSGAGGTYGGGYGSGKKDKKDNGYDSGKKDSDNSGKKDTDSGGKKDKDTDDSDDKDKGDKGDKGDKDKSKTSPRIGDGGPDGNPGGNSDPLGLYGHGRSGRGLPDGSAVGKNRGTGDRSGGAAGTTAGGPGAVINPGHNEDAHTTRQEGYNQLWEMENIAVNPASERAKGAHSPSGAGSHETMEEPPGR